MKTKLSTKRTILFFVVVLLILLSACKPSAGEETPLVTTASFPLKIIDQANRTVTIERIPEKIVSLAPEVI